MPVHFGFPVTSNQQRPSHALRARGLNLLRAAPSQVRISLVPDVILFAYTVFVSVLGAFLSSLSRKEVVSNGQCRRIGKLPHSIPLRLPPLGIRIMDGNAATLNAFHALGFESQEMQGKETLLKDRPTQADYLRAMTDPTIDRKCKVPWNFVNLEAMMVFVTLQKIATLFLGLDILPAFDGSSRTVAGFLKSEKDLSTPTTGADSAVQSSTVASSSTHKYSWNWKRAVFKFSSLDSSPKALQFGKDTVGHFPVNYTTLSDFATKLGTSKDNGIFFPFVLDLSSEDNIGPIDFIRVYAFSCLGDSWGQCFEELNTIRRGWGILKKTVPGQQLAHLYRCMELTLNAQGALAALVSSKGRYDGCVILGSGFSVISDNLVTRPLANEDLVKELTNYGSHEASLQKIVKILTSRKTTGQQINESPTTMAQLREQVLSVTLNETDREEIRQHATHLDFEEETWGVNPGSLLKFLKIVHDASMPDFTPITYLALFETHVGRAALSAFGYAACPSFLIPSGRSLDLTKTMPAANVTIPGSRKRKSDDSVDDFVLTVQVQLVD